MTDHLLARAALSRQHAEDVADDVADRNVPEPRPAEPRGGLIERHDPGRLDRLLDDPLATTATVAAEVERRALELDALEARHAALKAVEEREAEAAAERDRLQAAAGAELVATLDAVRAEVAAIFPGVDLLAERVEAAVQAHADALYPLGVGHAVADRVLWAHPAARLLPLLDLLRRDGPTRWQPGT